MECNKCGHEITSEQKFCGNCGAAVSPHLKIMCKQCGIYSPPGSKYCGGCGANIEATQELPTPQQTPLTKLKSKHRKKWGVLLIGGTLAVVAGFTYQYIMTKNDVTLVCGGSFYTYEEGFPNPNTGKHSGLATRSLDTTIKFSPLKQTAIIDTLWGAKEVSIYKTENDRYYFNAVLNQNHNNATVTTQQWQLDKGGTWLGSAYFTNLDKDHHYLAYKGNTIKCKQQNGPPLTNTSSEKTVTRNDANKATTAPTRSVPKWYEMKERINGTEYGCQELRGQMAAIWQSNDPENIKQRQSDLLMDHARNVRCVR